jgi:hypothetical protein
METPYLLPENSGDLQDRRKQEGFEHIQRVPVRGPWDPLFRTLLNPTRDKVEARGRFTSQGLALGNQQRRWHGTTRKCRIGDNGQATLCCSRECSLCCIIRSSFDISQAMKKTGWGRFGRGIYTSSASSKFVWSS